MDVTQVEIGKEYWSTKTHELVAVVQIAGQYVEVENEGGERFMQKAEKLEVVNDYE